MAFLITQPGEGSQNYKTAVRAASSANVALTGSAPLLLGGVTLANKDRVLLKDQALPEQNGIYEITISGGSYTMVRAADANTSREVIPNILVPVSEGTYADQLFQLTTNGPIVLDTTPLVFGFAVLYDHGLLPGLGDDDHTQYHNDTRALTWLGTRSTADLPENVNYLYFTDQRAIDAVVNNVDISDLNDYYDEGIHKNVVYVNDNEKDIQQALTEVGASQGYSIFLSPGSFGGATVTVQDKSNLQIIGPATPSGAHQCELASGRALTISGAASTRVRLLNFEIEGLLTINGTLGRHYFRDMQFTGGFTLSGATSNFLVFQNCSFGGPVSIPNTFAGVIYFIQCDFGNQTITNLAAVAAQVVVANCNNLNSFSFGNRTLVGQNILASGQSRLDTSDALVSSLTASRVVVSDANKFLTSSAVSTTELGYLGGVTSSVQTQLNDKEKKGYYTRIAKSANYSIATTDDYIGCDSSLASFTVTLPAANTVQSGKRYIIKDEGGSATTNNIFIAPNGTDKIDGVNASESLVVNYESITLICDGVDGWFLI